MTSNPLQRQSCAFTTLPLEICLHSIAPYLSKTEQYRLFALSKIWIQVLREVRTFTFESVDIWNRFCQEEDVRRKVFEMVGLPFPPTKDKVSPKFKITSKYFEYKQMSVHDFQQYIGYFSSVGSAIFCSDIRDMANNSYLHLVDPSRLSHEIDFNCHHWRYLYTVDPSRLQEVEIDHSVITEDLNRIQDLSTLCGFKNIRWTSRDCFSYDLHHSITGRLQRAELFGSTNIHDVSHLAKVPSVYLSGSSVEDVTPLKYADTIVLEDMILLEDISMLGNVRCLDVDNCPKIAEFPAPTGCNQEWSVYGTDISDVSSFRNLLRCHLRNCFWITDISMLDNVKYLSVIQCYSIAKFPRPTSVGQEWTFKSCNIQDVTGFNQLHSLELNLCPNIRDISPLANIHTLTIEACEKVKDASSLGNVKLLTLIACDVTDVSMLHNVEELQILQCNHVQSLEGLHNLIRKDSIDKLTLTL